METQEEKNKIKAKVLRAMEADRQRLLLKLPFIGSLMMQQELVPVFDDRVPTACTDGRHIFVSCRFYASLTMPERLFVMAHEIWHTALMHFQRCQNRDHELFNIASDLEIHFVLLEEHFVEPFVLPHDPNWRGLSAEQIYAKLLEVANPQELGCGVQSANIKDIRPDGGMDTHLTDADAINTMEPADDIDENGENMEGGQTNAPEFDPDFNPIAPSQSTETVRRQLIQSAQRAERQQGYIPNAMQQLLNELRHPQLRWQELLKQYVTSAYGGERHWLPPARRYIGSGLYLPSRRSKRLQAVVAIDTSGSTQPFLPQFFGELNGILNSFGSYDLTLIQADAAVQQVDHYDHSHPMEFNQDIIVKGGGGTDFRPVFDYIRSNIRKPNVVLFLTDGYGTAPRRRPSYPVMWVLSPDGQSPSPWGRKLQLKD